VEPGFNSRLDELQAALLRVKLPHLERWNAERRRLAALYDELLAGIDTVTPPEPDEGHVYHLYVIRSTDRDGLRARLAEKGVGSSIHYPTPVHLQAAYRDGEISAGPLPVTERLAGAVLSLPLYPGLSEGEIREVAGAVRALARG
jgi:dTDP-4-amino-4,6-dideoxygalactose transaminase